LVMNTMKKQIEAFLMGLLAFGFAPGTAKF
jgi:hypothetical protein